MHAFFSSTVSLFETPMSACEFQSCQCLSSHMVDSRISELNRFFFSESHMEDRKSSKSLGDLTRIYRYSIDIAHARQRFLLAMYLQEERGATVTQSSSIGIDNIRVRISQLTFKRHREIVKVYTNGDVNRAMTPRPKTSSSRYQSSRPLRSAPLRPLPKPRSIPRPSSALQPMKVTNITIKDEMAIVKMQPTSTRTDPKDKDEEENDDDIVYPEGVTDRRPYQIVARYRRAVGGSTNFRNQPLKVGDDSTETLVLGLDSFAEGHGCQLIFSDEEHRFDNSIYRAAGGVVDFGSVHLLATDSLLTANFQFEVDLTHEKNMMQSKERIEKFVMDFCAAISRELKCEKNEVRVFSINQKDKTEKKTEVNFGLTSSNPSRTEQLALHLRVIFCHLERCLLFPQTESDTFDCI